MPRPEDRLVYSTDQPFTVPPKNNGARAPSSGKTPPNDGVIRIAREKRRASVVTLIHGLAPGEVAAIARELQRACGGGGSTKGGIITLQGDHRDRVVAYFSTLGRPCKKAGG